MIELVQIKDGRIWLGHDPGISRFKLPPSVDRESESESSVLNRNRSARKSEAPSPHLGNTGRTSILNSQRSDGSEFLQPPESSKSRHKSKHSKHSSSHKSRRSSKRVRIPYDHSSSAPQVEP